MSLLLMILGGASGAALRHAIERSVFRAWPGDSLPWAPFAVNFGGCFVLGILLGRAIAHGLPASVYVFLGGAITAFGVFGHRFLELTRSGLHAAAGLRAFTGWLVGTGAAVAGVVVGVG